MTLSVSVASLTFSDGSELSLNKNDIVVMVGPNNAGKSTALRDIRFRLDNPHNQTNVIRALRVNLEGTSDNLLDWFKSHCPLNRGGRLQRLQHEIPQSDIVPFWEEFRERHSSPALARFFMTDLDTQHRLSAADPTGLLDFTESPPIHPLHYLHQDDGHEKYLSNRFREAFGSSLILNRGAGARATLHIGDPPAPAPGEDRVSPGYIAKLKKLPLLHTQGDGMKSFVGCLLHSSIIAFFIVLIDEPEAFLHPPQARLLGRMLASDKATGRQLFLATHSGDLLRGLLDAESASVRVIRIQRCGEVNIAKELEPIRVRELWQDSLLRYSNILDGLFHESVILCESDSDCRFYRAIMDAMIDSHAGGRRPDTMFTHCGGKERMPMVVRSLRGLDVPMRVICDFDLLRNEQPLRSIYEGLGGDWSSIQRDWTVLISAINDKRPELNADETKRKIQEVLEGVQSQNLPDSAVKAIRQITRKSSPWSEAKNSGTSFIPQGDPSASWNNLNTQLKGKGLHIVPVGEIERFCPTISEEGPSFVNQVLRRDLTADPELENARKFVQEIFL